MCGSVMKRFLLLIVMLSALSGCAWIQGRAQAEPARLPVSDPSIVERDLSKPYVPETFEVTRDGGAP